MNIAVDAGGRTKWLKASTHAAHERLDKRIMAADPFSARQRYGQFVVVQRAFHRDIDALYHNAELDRILPDLVGRRRLPQIEQDLADLGIAAPQFEAPPAFAAEVTIDIPTALGWLYVAEGSNLGAAFLLKEAIKLGLSETSGASHLAAAPEGRGLHWRTFTGALDALSLLDAEETRAVAGADAAFARVFELVERELPPAENAKLDVG